jgi:hypothetical protein
MSFFRRALSIVALASGLVLTIVWAVILGFEFFKLADTVL